VLVRIAELHLRVRDRERGGVLVLVAVWLPLAVLLASFVIDIANWFEHKRHLQMQADAAALAGAREMRVPCADQPVLDETRAYSGDTYNAQIGGTDPANVHTLINSRTYFNQSSPTDDTVNTGNPCVARMIDVKMTESDLPWFFRAASLPFINSHARVSVLQADTFSGTLPVGVPDVNPKAARAMFIDESNGSVIATTSLTRQPGTVNGLAIWDNSGSPLPVTTNPHKIGVRIALGGASSTTCGQPFVECYDAGSANGLLHARGWSGAGSGAQPGAPLARSVTLFNGSCSDPYFSSSGTSCTIGVRAKVDFGGGSTAVTAVGAQLTATVGGQDYPLTYNSGSDTWQSNATIPVTPGAGPVPVELKWEETKGSQGGNTCKTGGGNKCTGTFGTVQRSFGASTARSGPIELAQIWENGSFWANSFETCSSVQTQCTHNLVVRIGIKGALEDAGDANDPIVSLRVVGGSQNQSLDCDPAVSQFKDELATGCSPTYRRNSSTACPGGPNDLWNSPQPWPCVALQTGTAVNQVPSGLNKRILGDEKAATCTAPNHWSDFPDFQANDPRIVEVFLTPYGSFNGSGSGTVPVTGFATFYMTGWTAQGQGFANPCQGNGDDPVPNNDAGYIVGHFIKYIDTLGNGGGGTELCDFDSFGTCVATLTE
jgi:Flp pilus assembly protein TadG